MLRAVHVAFSTPKLWGLIIIPWIMSGALLVACGWGLWNLADWATEHLIDYDRFTGVIGVGLKLFLGICLVGFAYFGIALIVQLLSAPVYDLIATRVVHNLNRNGVGIAGPAAQVSFFKAMKQVIVHQTANILIWLLITIVLFLASWLLPIMGQVFAAVGSFLTMAAILAFDSLDYMMSRRAWDYRDKWRFVRQNIASLWLLFIVLAALVSIPFAGLFFLPLSPIAGTLLFVAKHSEDRLADAKSE